MAKPLIAGNWKMNGLAADLTEAVALAQALAQQPAKARVALCPPATLIERAARALADSPVLVGAEDCHAQVSGAFTGDISAEMLADAGAVLVVVGHSERRAGHGESDADVAAKALAAARAGLEPIICVGETLAEREAGRALEIVTGQIKGSVPAALAGGAVTVAYEPVWAIGTGLTPTIPQIEEVHGAIRQALVEVLGPAGAEVGILYGGSVKPDNAVEILRATEVGGALVGGASLKAADFLQIIRAV
ncbi:MAG: triose-phosphate isomerase [Caulobacteraceae bacterium]|nr:triose-phosphate isomerase [Caulobacteraceae bacterium]